MREVYRKDRKGEKREVEMTREEGNKGGEQNKFVHIRTQCTSI